MLGNKGTREYLADKMCNLKKLKFFDIIFIENKELFMFFPWVPHLSRKADNYIEGVGNNRRQNNNKAILFFENLKR